MTAPRLLELGLIDKVVREPLGGAHRNPHSMAIRLKAVLLNELDELEAMPVADLLEQRYQRLRSYGAYPGISLPVARGRPCPLGGNHRRHPPCRRESPWPTTPPSSPY